MSLSARIAIDEMRMKRVPFAVRKLAVQIGDQPYV